jgi:hypothetical protein
MAAAIKAKVVRNLTTVALARDLLGKRLGSHREDANFKSQI